MLPRHAYLSALGLALSATMSEDDLDAPPDLWSKPLGRAMVDDMRADEEAGAAVEAKVVAAFPHMQPWEAQGSHYDLPRVSGPPDDSMRFLLRSWDRDRPEQRASKKARAKRKAKKGWA